MKPTTVKIRVLDARTVGMISAGEVVERPASVVKELVENAIDAGASSIRCEVVDGGRESIRVVDDGVGMDRDEALLAIERHATSKIASFEDLERVMTLGFRGEALPSIAAISRMEILTRRADVDGAVRVEVEGGRVVAAEESTRNRGTTISVRHLFYNTPARKKFLRSRGTEFRKIVRVVMDCALSNPTIAWRLEHDGRSVLDCPATDSLPERARDLLPDDVIGGLVPLVFREGEFEMHGLIARPEEVRPGDAREFFFVNGRPVRSARIRKAVRSGYRATLRRGLKPNLLLFLTLPPAAVDVNVHPTKSEVKFRDDDAISEFVEHAVTAALGAPGAIPDYDRGPGPTGAREASEATYGGARDGETVDQMSFLFSGGMASEIPETEDGGDGTRGEVYYPSMVQVHNTFILVQTRRGVLIIDQHASHERVLYERLIDSFAGGTLTSQRLLFPLTFHLNPAQFQAVMEQIDLFRAFGFEIEPFGGRSVILHAAPSLHPRFEVETAFREMVDDLVESARPGLKQHENVAKTIACKAAIKAGQALSREEMCELFDRLFATRVPSRDIHGRPTMVQIGIDELRRRFERG